MFSHLWSHLQRKWYHLPQHNPCRQGHIDPSMVRKSEVLSGHLVLLLTLFLLCVVSAKSSSTVCQNCPAEPLFRTKQMIASMKGSTRKLYRAYVRLNRMQKGMCRKAVPWFPAGTITSKPVSAILQELDRTLELMEDSLAQIREQQTSLQPPNSSLPGKLERAKLTAKGLHINTRCVLCSQGLTPVNVTLPARRTGPAFDQKVRGCQVLWNYSRFLSTLDKAFQGAAQ